MFMMCYTYTFDLTFHCQFFLSMYHVHPKPFAHSYINYHLLHALSIEAAMHASSFIDLTSDLSSLTTMLLFVEMLIFCVCCPLVSCAKFSVVASKNQ